MMQREQWDIFWKKHNFPIATKAGFNMEKRAILDILNKLVEKNARVIDFGCGEGRTLSYIRTDFKNSIGIDTSTFAIARCKSKGFAFGKDVFMDARNVGKCDLLFSQGLLEHYKKEEWPEVINKMVGLSNKYIVLMQPLTESLIYKILGFIERHYSSFWDCVVEYDYSTSDFIEEFEKHGFKRMIVKTTHHLPEFLDTSVLIVLEKIKRLKI